MEKCTGVFGGLGMKNCTESGVIVPFLGDMLIFQVVFFHGLSPGF